MVHSGPSKWAPGDKGLFHTGMFLRPRIASALEKIIRNKMVRETAQFTVGKTQIHPDGNCEMLVRRLDPNVSTATIMDVLKKCRDLVKESSLAEPVSTLNRTIDISDDDSVCVLSPARFNQRTVKFSATGSPQSSIIVEKSVEPESPLARVNNNQLVTSANDEITRMVTLKRTASEDISAATTKSLGPMPKRPNITVVVSNDLKSSNLISSTPIQNGADTLLPFSEDVLPSAPTWTCAEPCKFPLSKITKIFGVKEKFDSDIEQTSFSLQRANPVPQKQGDSDASVGDSWINAQPSKFPLSNISRILGVKDTVKENDSHPSCSSRKGAFHNTNEVGMEDPKTKCGPEHPKRLFSEVLKVDRIYELSKPSITDVSIEIVDEVPSRHASVMCKDKQPKTLQSASEENKSAKSLIVASDPAKSIPKSLGNCSQNKSASPTLHVGSEKNAPQSGSSGSSESSESESSDDEIIIEKEFKNNARTPSLIIDDSDDDIAICEVVKEKKKSKSKKQKKKGVLSAGTGPAPDFIPLFSTYRRIDPETSNRPKNFTLYNSAPDFIPLGSQRTGPKTSNCPKNPQKMAKLQKLRMKGQHASKAERRAHTRAQHHQQLRATDASQSSSKDDSSKKKQDYNGSVMNPNSGEPKSGLRPIIIDGCNVAIGHGKGHFSVPGLKICIKYFTDRGHTVHTFVPKFKRFHVSPEDRKALDDLEKGGSLSFTPSRTMQDGRKVASYDDRFIVQAAAELGGIIVSTDNYRDLLAENESWRETIEQRLLMFTWVGDMLLFPNDPLGRDGPHLQDFLRFPDPPAK